MSNGLPHTTYRLPDMAPLRGSRYIVCLLSILSIKPGFTAVSRRMSSTSNTEDGECDGCEFQKPKRRALGQFDDPPLPSAVALLVDPPGRIRIHQNSPNFAWTILEPKALQHSHNRLHFARDRTWLLEPKAPPQTSAGSIPRW